MVQHLATVFALYMNPFFVTDIIISVVIVVVGQTIVQLRNEHLSYLITWFTLTIAMSIIWWKRHMTPKPKINIQAMMEENRKIRELQNKMNGRDQR